MSKLNQAVLKVAQQNPEFAKALTAELTKTARPDFMANLRVAKRNADAAGNAITKQLMAHEKGRREIKNQDVFHAACISGALNFLLALKHGAEDASVDEYTYLDPRAYDKLINELHRAL